MPVRTVEIYEVPNSYVTSGGPVTISATFYMTINDDDTQLDGTSGSDTGTAQNISGSFGTATGYQFFYNDNITLNGSTETVKTFQLTIGGVTRSFIMNNTGGSIAGAGVGNTVNLNSYSGYTPVNYSSIPCFCAGTDILTPDGPVSVESLKPGDLVETLDNGAQPIRWVGCTLMTHRELLARPEQAPIRIAKDALGRDLPNRDLFLSPQHRVLLEGWAVELAIGENEAFSAAKSLLGWHGIEQVESDSSVLYYHIMFEDHEIVESNGLKTESFLLGDTIIDGMDADYVDEIDTHFPGIRASTTCLHNKAARPIMKPYEIAAMQQAAA